MSKHQSSIFTRNSDAGSLIDIFLISAVSAILLIRTFLHITGYPQVGGGTYHIAHMLWGGILMMLAIVLSISYFGRKIQRLVALFGGLGFGIFIDELGKFITKDNNYFFEPTIGLIYAMFAIIYIASNFLIKHERFTPTEYRLNALRLAEDVIRNDLDKNEKAEIEELLKKADARNPISKKLIEFIHDIDTISENKPTLYRKVLNSIDDKYEQLLRTRRTDRFIQVVTILMILISMIGIYYLFHQSYSSVTDFIANNPGNDLDLEKGQIVSTIISQGFAYFGVLFIIKDRYKAFYFFNVALVINIFLTQFFMFARVQFDAIPFFLGNLLMLAVVRFVLNREKIIKSRQT